MFDAVKFTGDKIQSKDLLTTIDCGEILGVYPATVRHNEDGSMYYEISDNAEGKLLVYMASNCHTPSAIYIKNDVETSQLVDLL